MDIERIIDLLDNLLDTKKKRHIVGGLLLSFSSLFAGLAITSITVKEEEKQNE